MGSGSASQKVTVRYAAYIEDHHEDFLDLVATKRDAVIDDSPYDGYTDIVIEAAFFGTGYTIASFPTMYDMFGKFMAGLDVEVLFDQAFEDTVNAPQVSDLVSAEADLLDDDIEANIIPRFELGMRDINSVMSSSFVVGKSIIEDGRVKSLAKFSAELKYRLIPVAVERWKTHLNWNMNVIQVYTNVMKLYYESKFNVNNMNYDMSAKNKLWPFVVLEYDRAAIGALQGATTTKSGTDTPLWQQILSGIPSVLGLASMFL